MFEIQTSLNFRQLSCVPFLDSPNFKHCLKTEQPNFLKSELKYNWIYLSLAQTVLYIKKIYMTLNPQSDLAQFVQILDSWDCWFCSDFGHDHSTWTSEIQCIVWVLDAQISDIHCIERKRHMQLDRLRKRERKGTL